MQKKIFALLYLFLSTGLASAQINEVLGLLNESRTDPQKFSTERLAPYLKAHEMEGNSYAKSLLETLKAGKKSNPLKLSATLTKLARSHAQDMGSKDKVGHNSSNGTTFEARVRKKIKTGLIAENCDYGNSEPLDIVMSLLIDDGIQSLGHRINILHPRLNFIGISIEPHKTYRMNCVMDFSEKEN